MKLSAARVFVQDLALAEAFYGSKLGLERVAGGAGSGYCVFQAGSCQLVLESVPNDAPADEQSLVGRFTGLSFSDTDVRARFSELTAKGVQFVEPPEAQPWGGILATFLDPSGNKLQLVQYPHAA